MIFLVFKYKTTEPYGYIDISSETKIPYVILQDSKNYFLVPIQKIKLGSVNYTIVVKKFQDIFSKFSLLSAIVD